MGTEMKKISKLIQKCQDNNVVDMYETFSELMAEKVINNINARQATIASNLLEDCGCEDCQCAKKKKVECAECDGEGCEHCDGKGYHLDESYLYEASPKIKYAKIVKGIRDSQGPFSVVAIKNGKVVAQKNSIKNSKMLPIEVNDMADAHPGATISIEGKGGKILNTFKESVELDEGRGSSIGIGWKKTASGRGTRSIDPKPGTKEVQKIYKKGNQGKYGTPEGLIGTAESPKFKKDTATDANSKGDIKITFKDDRVRKAFEKQAGIKESYMNEASQRFGGDTNIPADKKTKGYIESGRAKILINVPSSLHKTARFVVAKNPNTGSNQDKVLMFTISDPDRGRIKMFSFHGSHVSHQKAMDFAKHHKLVAMKDAKGRPLYAKESVELDEATTWLKWDNKSQDGQSYGREMTLKILKAAGYPNVDKLKKKDWKQLSNKEKQDIQKVLKTKVAGSYKLTESVDELNEVKWDKNEKRIVPKWEKGLERATSRVKGTARGLKNGKVVHEYRVGGAMIKSAVGVLFKDFKADTVEILHRGKVVYTLDKKEVMKNGKLIDESYLYEAGIFDKPRKEYLKLAKAKLGKGKTRTFEFPNNRLASQFAKDMSNGGIATTELVDSTKVQVQMLPGNKSVGKSGLAKYLKKSRGKELNESVISKLQESYTSKMPVDIDIDGKVLHITPDVTEDVIMLYNGLNENNKEKMLNLLESDIKSFAKIARFAGKRN
jgi:hypothetical protein